jgi:hypothetical protein
MQRLLLVSLAFFLLLLACSREEEKAKGPQPGTKKEAVAPELPPQVAYHQKAAARLEKLEHQVKQLQAAAEKSPPADRAKLHELTKGLAPKLEAARQKLKELQGSTGTSWQDFQPAVDAALADLDKASQQARQAARHLLQKQKAAYQKQVADQLGKRVLQVEDLNLKVKKLPPKSRAKLYGDLTELQKKLALARKKFRQLQTAAPERWEAAVPGMESALQSLQKSYLAVQSHYQRLTSPPAKRPHPAPAAQAH